MVRVSLSLMMIENTLYMVLTKAIGRWLESFSGGDFFVIKVTTQSFHEGGKTPCVRAELMMVRICSTNSRGRHFKTSFGMPSGPGARRVGRRLSR